MLCVSGFDVRVRFGSVFKLGSCTRMFYPQDRDLVLLVSHQQGEPRQRFLQVFTKNLHPLRRRHFLVLLVLTLNTTTNKQISQSANTMLSRFSGLLGQKKLTKTKRTRIITF